MTAVVHGLSEIVADLVVYPGTDWAIVDNFRRTAHTEALRVKKPWIVEMLLKAPEDIRGSDPVNSDFDYAARSLSTLAVFTPIVRFATMEILTYVRISELGKRDV